MGTVPIGQLGSAIERTQYHYKIVKALQWVVVVPVERKERTGTDKFATCKTVHKATQLEERGGGGLHFTHEIKVVNEVTD